VLRGWVDTPAQIQERAVKLAATEPTRASSRPLRVSAAACICVLANCETGWRSPLRTAERRLAAMGALGAHSHRHAGIAALVAAVAALCMGLGAGTAFAQSTPSFDQGSRAWLC